MTKSRPPRYSCRIRMQSRSRVVLPYRDAQELLQERGVAVGHDTLREWNITFSPLAPSGPCIR
jgi:transposase-like protein